MNDKVSPTMADLINCRKIIIKQIEAVKILTDGLCKELRTLEAALMHVEQRIADLKGSNSSKLASANKAKKKPAA